MATPTTEDLYLAVQRLKLYFQENFPYKHTYYEGTLTPTISGFSAPTGAVYAQKDLAGNVLRLWLKTAAPNTSWGNLYHALESIEAWAPNKVYASFELDNKPIIVWEPISQKFYYNIEDFTSSTTFAEDQALLRWALLVPVTFQSQTDPTLDGTVVLEELATSLHFTTTASATKTIDCSNIRDGSIVYVYSDLGVGAITLSGTGLTFTLEDFSYLLEASSGIIARSGNTIHAVGLGKKGTVRYDLAQALTDTEKRQAQDNLSIIVGDSAGVVTGGNLSINGIDNTQFDISTVYVIGIDLTLPEHPLTKLVSYGPFIGLTATYLADANVTYIGVDNALGTVVQQMVPFTNTQRRTISSLGAIIHSNRTFLNATNDISNPALAGVSQLHDLVEAIGAINLTGNTYSANGANLNINVSAGSIFKLGCNFQTNPSDPHKRDLASASALTFRYRNQDSVESGDTSSIDPNNYDNAGVTTTVPNNRWTAQLITRFQSGLTRVQRGQTVYLNSADAIAAVTAANTIFAIEQNIRENGIRRAWLVVKKGATALNGSDAFFLEIGKFSGASGNSALSALPNNYVLGNNSGTTAVPFAIPLPVQQYAAFANLPVSGNTGVLYLLDNGYTYYWDGLEYRLSSNRNTVTTVTSVSGVLTIDLSLGTYFKTTLFENVSTIVLLNSPASGYGESFMLWLAQDPVTARTVNFDTSIFRPALGETLVVSTTLSSINLVGASYGYDAKWDTTLVERA